METTTPDAQAPQHLLCGLNVAILAAPGARGDHVLQTKTALEELGVNVLVLSEAAGPVPRVAGDGSPMVHAVQRLADADPEAFDAAVVPGGAVAAGRLCRNPLALAFLRRLGDEHKPLAALGEGVAVVREAGAVAALSATASGEGAQDAFHTELRHRFADRRRHSFASASSDLPSALGGGCGGPAAQGHPGFSGRLDALRALETDHQRLEAHFSDYERAGEDLAARRALARVICMELRLHSLLEEEIFYPAFRKATGDQRLVQRVLAEHGHTARLMEEIEGAGEPDALIGQLREVVMRHVQDEREQVFPRARTTPQLDLAALGASIQSRRAQLVDNVATN